MSSFVALAAVDLRGSLVAPLRLPLGTLGAPEPIHSHALCFLRQGFWLGYPSLDPNSRTDGGGVMQIGANVACDKDAELFIFVFVLCALRRL